MIASRANRVFLTGDWSYRSGFTLKGAIVCFGLSAAASCLGIWALAAEFTKPFPTAGIRFFVGVTLCMIGLVALIVGFVSLRSFVVAKVDELEISDRGVKYGSEFWPWDSLAAIRFRRLPHNGPIRIVIWPRRDRGLGRGFFTDEVCSPEQIMQLEGELKGHFIRNNLSITCEREC